MTHSEYQERRDAISEDTDWCSGCSHPVCIESKKTHDRAIDQLVLDVIGKDNEHTRDMPVPDPFARPQDYANSMKQYQRKIVNGEQE